MGALVLLALLVARVDAAPTAAASAPAGDLEGTDDDAWSDGAVAAPGESSAPTESGPPDALLDPAEVAAVARSAPSVRFAIAAAYRVAGLADDPAPGFAHRSRLAALVPWIGVRVGEDETWADVAEPTIGHMFVYDIRATWHFDRLVFDPNELRASAIEIARRRDRRRLSLLVSRTYYAWLRARAAAVRAPGWAIRADQAATELDALTDGAWTAR